MPETRKRNTNMKEKNGESSSNSTKQEETSTKDAATETAVEVETHQDVDSFENDEINVEAYADVSQERSSIISIVKDLEGQVDTAFKLKEAIEADLEETQKKLYDESTARAQLEEQVKSLEAQATLADQLRQDISFAEEERNKFANLLDQLKPQIEIVTQERDSFAEKINSLEANNKKLDEEKTTFEAQVMNLKEKVVALDRLRQELDETNLAQKNSNEQLRDITSRLEDSESLKTVLERDLAETHEAMHSMREVVEDLREKFSSADREVADLHTQLEEQRVANKALIEAKTRLENVIDVSNVNHQTIKNELDMVKKALREIHNEAALSSGRVRQRYFKPKDNK